ncbi:MAG: TrkA-N domain protein [Actinobacteria bacterium]|nr:TrkA-N domain protein [Actinomycetota bacterium]MEA2504825.1 trk/ktr system potassium uptake protein [Actinomycetota bacterium]MEA2592531.1 trk/ktr system potassium uptake protein [Actinomycetota bacterium]
MYRLPVHAVIVGCGRVGAELADALTQRNFSVSIIDKNPAAFEHLHPGFGGKTLVGPGFDRDILEEAGIKEADVFIAVTNGDNSNIVCARIAKEHYGRRTVAARIYDPRRAQIYERLGIPTVATVAWTTDQVLARVMPPSEAILGTIGSGAVVAIGVEVPDAAAGARVSELNVPGRILITAVTRFGQTEVAEPRLILQEGDFLNLVVMRGELGKLSEHLASRGKALRV